jgi:FAD-dependent oxidoreductase domain-containing protein 1
MSKEKRRIVVFERDATYEWASAPRSAGGIRQQFSLRANVELSIYGVDFLKRGLSEMCTGLDGETDVQFKENGYLLLASASGEEILRQNAAVQWEAGADWITLLDPAALKARFPWLSTKDIALGSFGTRNEGPGSDYWPGVEKRRILT